MYNSIVKFMPTDDYAIQLFNALKIKKETENRMARKMSDKETLLTDLDSELQIILDADYVETQHLESFLAKKEAVTPMVKVSFKLGNNRSYTNN